VDRHGLVKRVIWVADRMLSFLSRSYRDCRRRIYESRIEVFKSMSLGEGKILEDVEVVKSVDSANESTELVVDESELGEENFLDAMEEEALLYESEVKEAEDFGDQDDEVKAFLKPKVELACEEVEGGSEKDFVSKCLACGDFFPTFSTGTDFRTAMSTSSSRISSIDLSAFPYERVFQSSVDAVKGVYEAFRRNCCVLRRELSERNIQWRRVAVRVLEVSAVALISAAVIRGVVVFLKGRSYAQQCLDAVGDNNGGYSQEFREGCKEWILRFRKIP